MFGISRLNKPQPSGVKKKVLEFAVGGRLGKKMSDNGWAGFTCPLPFFVIILYWVGPKIPMVNPLVRVHEGQHALQDQENFCFFISWCKYLYEYFRERWIQGSWAQAYMHNKYEVEAYAVEDAVYDGEIPMPAWTK